VILRPLVFLGWVYIGNPYWRGRLSTVTLLIKIGCFGTKKNMLPIGKAPDLN
jgi:hypothetical protein